MAPKPDADAIRAVLAARRAAHGGFLGGRAWWMDFAFHFTDIRNAVGILSEDRLYCRAHATEQGLMIVENADRTVVQRRADLTDHFARLYLRPRTPTQWRNEGTRPIGQRPSHDAHCPVPIFFLFDLPELLVENGTFFTEWAAAWDEAELLQTAKDLERMPWRDIYSSGGMGDRAHELTGRRRAEILVDHSLGLENLTRVVCRTGPERDTLLHLLPDAARTKWRGKIVLPGRAELYENRWTYVQNVTWTADALVFAFSPTAATFQVKFRIVNLDTGAIILDRQFAWTFAPPFSFKFPVADAVQHVEVRIELDDSLVYNAVVRREALLRR